jgi:uncharacterized protein YndB with AHSA1/START domain
MTTVRTGSLLGWVSDVDGAGTVHVEDVYDTGIDDLWEAVTDPARLVAWLGHVEGDLRVGGWFAAAFTSTWEGRGRVDECEVPNRLLVTLEPGTPDQTRIEAVLSVEDERTRLVVEERGLPVDEAPDHGAGWQAHIEDLRAHLQGHAPAPWRERWQELIPSYRPEAR